MKKQLLSIIAAVLFIGGFQQGKAQTGAALNFDGVNDYVSVGNVLPVSYTKEAWIYINSDDGSNNIISGGDADGQHAFWAPSLILSAGHNAAWGTVADNTTLNLNQWYHVAVTYDSPSQTMSLYKNGVLVSQATGVVDYIDGNMVRVGAYNDAQNLFIGNIDEVRIWNFALSASQINNTMNCTISGTQAGLVLYYNFDQGIANGNNTSMTTVTDVSGNGNTGTLNNFALTGTASNFVPNATLSVQVTTTITATSNTVCAGTPVTLTATNTAGGTSPYMYTWHPGGTAGSSATLTNTTTITPSATSTVTAVKKWWALVTDANGCAYTNDTAAVQVNSLPQVSTLASTTITCAGSPVTLTAVPVGGGLAPLSYTWHPGGTAPSATVTTITPSATTATSVKKWFMTVQDANGCVFTNDTVAVQINSLPQVSTLVSTTITCAGSPVTLTAVPVGGGLAPLSYTWHPGGTAPSATVTTITPSATTATSVKKWFMTVQDANGCTFTNDTVAIQVNALPNVTINGLNSSTVSPCPNVTGTLTAAGANTYTWTPGNLHTNTLTGAPASSVTFTLTGTDVNGCNNTATEFVNVLPKPTLTVTPLISNICVGATATLTVSGANTYTWNTGTIGTSITPSPTVTTNYTVTGTGANSCTNTAVTLINVDNAVITVNSPSICIGNTATLTANGGSTYTWSTTETTTSIAPSPTVTTDYTVTGTDLNNCVSTTTSTVTINSLPTVSVNSATVCAGATTTLTASGTATSYSWNTTEITTSITPSPTITTNYTVTGTDANNCMSNAVSMVMVNSLPTVTVNSATICTGTTTTLTASGTATSYSWNTTETTTSITPSPTVTTNYTVTGTDANNCMNNAVSMVTVNSLPTVTVNSATICAGNGAILMASGATSYTWFPATGLSATTGSAVVATPISTSTCGVIGTDANNCTNIATSTVTVNSLPVITVNSATICVGAATTLTANGATSYTWNTTETTISITPSPTVTSNYTVTGTDGNNCSNTAIATVTVNSLPTLTITASTNTICAGSTTTLTASGATSYTWSTTETTASISPSPTVTTQYTVTGTDGNNCMNNDTLSIIVQNCTTGIDKLSNNVDQITVYPNPNNGTFVITTTENTKTILITDILGNELLSINPNGTTTSVNLSAQPNGIYFVKVISNGTPIVKRIIINN